MAGLRPPLRGLRPRLPSNRPRLRGSRPPHPQGAVLLLHGGAERGWVPMTWWSPSSLRMLPFVPDLHLFTHERVAVVRLKNRWLGWNGDGRTALEDARWALDVIRAELPGLPIAIVGHSMGGRVALRLAGEPDVRAVVGLAPWIVEDDPLDIPDAVQLLLMHGSWDRITDPALTARLAASLRDEGKRALFVGVNGIHSMLFHPGTWHRTTARFVRDVLLDGDVPPGGDVLLDGDVLPGGDVPLRRRRRLGPGAGPPS